ncbi:MAG: hypothetical protein Sapg2KO_50220 [Saprospiraceae bacterium]
MKTFKLYNSLLLSCLILNISLLQAQSGDQVLDGIGETDMLVRYVFDGNLKDWSRNNLEAKSRDSKAQFVKDNLFGTVLSLSPNDRVYVSIPGEILTGKESISISTWVYLRSKKRGQYIFDFGKNDKSHIFLLPRGIGNKENCQTVLFPKSGTTYQTNTPAIEANTWNHLVVVLDAPSKVLSTYLNGVLAGEVKAVEMELGSLFGQNDRSEDNILLIGKSLAAPKTNLDAKLHDFRIYRVPLNENQAKRIHDNALGRSETIVNTRAEKDGNLPEFSDSRPQLYNAYLRSVQDLEVETIVGVLPRLPRYVQGKYSNGIKGPSVRVLWPAPADNKAVLKPGQYTVTGRVSGTELRPKAIVSVKEDKPSKTPRLSLETFPLEAVSLNRKTSTSNSKFVDNRDKFITTLAQTNPDDFLFMFRNAFGQVQPEAAKPLKGWDSQETKLRGHATGHYLTALAQAYGSTTYDKSLQADFKDKMEYMVNTLYELSKLSGQAQEKGGDFVSDPRAIPPGPNKANYDSDLSTEGIRTDCWNWGTGFISAYPPDQFIMLEQGAIYGRDSSKVWAPYYTLHKILAGLLDIYEVTGNEKALEVAKGMGQWVYARLDLVPTETLISMWNTYIAGEFGGMNEVMARLYRLTKEQRFLKCAKLFDNIKMFYGDAQHTHGLAKNVDAFRGLHANQHIPQIIGALEMYRNSDAVAYYHIADNFWYKATNDYSYSIGGVAGARDPANAECFTSEPATLYKNGFSAGGQNETCATYNMLKLTKNLFLYDQRSAYMDYYERGLYNHILASVAKDSPANTYHVPLRPGSVKRFGNAKMTGFTCCNGTALESNTKFQNSIYFKSENNQTLYVNLYIPSTLDWEEKNLVIEQNTNFPNEDRTRLTIKGAGEFDLKLRIPSWANKGVYVKINGKKQKVNSTAGSYLTLSRKWKDGDQVELRLPFQFHLVPIMDQANLVSLFYGPILLAAQESEARNEWRKITLKAKNIAKTVKGDPEKLSFKIGDLALKPFYETYGRYSVYLDVTLK